MTDELTNKVIEIIADTQQIPVEKISPESTFAELGIDSLAGMGLVFELESSFNVGIPNEEALQMRTVRAAVESLRKLTTEQGANSEASA